MGKTTSSGKGLGLKSRVSHLISPGLPALTARAEPVAWAASPARLASPASIIRQTPASPVRRTAPGLIKCLIRLSENITTPSPDWQLTALCSDITQTFAGLHTHGHPPTESRHQQRHQHGQTETGQPVHRVKPCHILALRQRLP